MSAALTIVASAASNFAVWTHVTGTSIGALLKVSSNCTLPTDDYKCCVWLQEYVYKFNYDADGGVTVDVTTNGKAMDKSNKKKQQVCQLADHHCTQQLRAAL